MSIDWIRGRGVGLRWGGLAFLVLVSACAEGASGPKPPLGRFDRLTFVETEETGDYVFDLSELKGTRVPADAATGRPAHVRLEGRRRKWIRISGPIDLRPFTQVEVRFVADEPAELELRLAVRLDPAEPNSSEVFMRADPTPCHIQPADGVAGGTRVLLEVPGRLRKVHDALLVQVEGGPPAGFGLVGARCLTNVEGSWLEVGNERRLGRWASSERDVVARGRAGQRLAFDYHFASENDEPDASLTVSIDGQVALQLGPRSTAWSHVELPLSADVERGAEVEVRFALEGPRGVAAAIAGPAFCAPHVEAPTVLLVTSDTHRADHLGVASSESEVRTPVLDALAARGVVFLDAFSASNVTVPSHAALLTGVHPRDSNASDNRSVLADSARTLAELFRDAGWMTFASVSTSFLGAVNLQQGFDRLSVPAGRTRPANRTIARLERWLPDAEGKPLFVWLHVFDAHSPYEPPQEFIDQHWSRARDPRDLSIESPLFEGLELPPGSLDVRDRDYIDACYRAEVSYLDDQLDRVLSLARFENGVVAVTADHGECLGTHGGWHHRETLPHTLHVPLILTWPGAPAGAFVEEPVRQIDVGRTLLELAEIEDAEFPGTDLLTAEARAPKARFALAGERKIATVITVNSVFVLHLIEHDEFDVHEVQLFDRQDDPDCLVDLAATEPERAAKLRTVLIEWMLRRRLVDVGITSLVPLEELNALGYAYGEAPDLGEDWFDEDCDCERCAAFQ